jgi:hypothetical protein
LDREQGKDTSRAIVEFETESASKTALLLTNALIVDRPITVFPYSTKDSSPQKTSASPGTPVAVENITHRDFGGVKDDERVVIFRFDISFSRQKPRFLLL